jgi:hypothetical protein
MIAWTTKVFELLGINRDSIALFWMKWCAFVVALAALRGDIVKVGIPASWEPYIALAAMFIGISAAQHRTSDLPGEPKGTVTKGFIDKFAGGVGILLAAVLLTSGCGASLVNTEKLIRDGIAQSETNRCSVHVAPCLSDQQFRDVNLQFYRAASVGEEVTKLEAAHAAAPSDYLRLALAVDGAVTNLAQAFPKDTVIGKLIDYLVRASKQAHKLAGQ